MKAFYHQPEREPLEVFIVAKNDDGTFNVAREENGPVIVESVSASENGASGTITLPGDVAKPKAKRAKKKTDAADDKPEEGESQEDTPENPPSEGGDLQPPPDE